MSTKYQWPETNENAHEADFETRDPVDEKARPFVTVRCIAVRLSMSVSNKTGKADQVELALLCSKGSVGVLLGDHTVSDVTGKVIHGVKSFSGGAEEHTWGALARLGYDADKAAAHYANDVQATALRQQLKLAGRSDADIVKAMGMLALVQGDIAACGLGSVEARATVLTETDRPGSNFVVDRAAKGFAPRVRLGFINSVPREMSAKDIGSLLDLIGGSMGGKPAPAALRPPARTGTQTSAAPAGANTDSVEF